MYSCEGEDGDPRTANVLYSEWFDGRFGENVDAPTLKDFNVDIQQLTQEFMQSGVILVYGRRFQSPTFEQIFTLPITFYDASQQFRYIVNENRISIQVVYIDGSEIDNVLLTEFRYVLIPGGQIVTESAKYFEQMSYDQITDHFNILK